MILLIFFDINDRGDISMYINFIRNCTKKNWNPLLLRGTETLYSNTADFFTIINMGRGKSSPWKITPRAEYPPWVGGVT